MCPRLVNMAVSLIDFDTRAAEHEGRLRSLHIQNTSQCRFLMRSGDDVGRLVHTRSGARLERLLGNLDLDRLLEMALGNGGDPERHGGGEQRRLPLFGCLFQNGVQILGKSHVEHLIGLVQHDHLNRLELQGLSADMVQRPSRRRHDDIDTALERMELRTDGLSSIDREARRSLILCHSA